MLPDWQDPQVVLDLVFLLLLRDTHERRGSALPLHRPSRNVLRALPDRYGRLRAADSESRPRRYPAPAPPGRPPPAAAPVQTEVVARYTSDTTKFNKRFFDTELGRFQKLNPDGNPEQLFMQTREGAYAVFRISEVKGDHCFISIDVGGARKEKRVNYFNIHEIEIQRR